MLNELTELTARTASEPRRAGPGWPQAGLSDRDSAADWGRGRGTAARRRPVITGTDMMMPVTVPEPLAGCRAPASAKWGVHIQVVHIENHDSIFCILSIFFDTLCQCIFLSIQDSQLQTCILSASSGNPIEVFTRYIPGISSYIPGILK